MAEPHIAQRFPYVLEVDPGTYAWCACGRSATQPYCDGSHAGSGLRPVVQKIEAKTRIAWCGCKHTGSAPRCDGTHSRL
jgi:CDGSH-type Zn-finger protein